MGIYRCCESSPSDFAERPPASPVRRASAVIRWMLPAAGLAVLPKCPACLAAYVAVATGFGISLAAAAYLRMALVAMCLVTLSFIAVPRAVRIVAAITRALRTHPALAPSTYRHR